MIKLGIAIAAVCLFIMLILSLCNAAKMQDDAIDRLDKESMQNVANGVHAVKSKKEGKGNDAV